MRVFSKDGTSAERGARSPRGGGYVRDQKTDSRPTGEPEAPNTVVPSPAPSPEDSARIAVFDFDGTLIDTQSGLQFTKYLVLNGYISKRTFAKLTWWGLRYVMHLPHEQDAPREHIIADLAGMDRPQVLFLMRRFHDQCLTRHYRADALRRIRELKAEGYTTVLVSATFMGIASVAAEYAGLDGFVATRMAVDAQGHYTGQVDGEVIEGPEKVTGVARWADERFGEGNWIIQWAFGDHHSDEEILQVAQQPVCVDPGRTLKAIAKKRGWPIALWS